MTDAASLCLRCGLCCDGNLFTRVPLADLEVAPARARGLALVARPDGGSALRQRCAALSGCACEIYDQRPATCRSYRCMLLSALAADELAPAEAHALVAEAHARLAALAAALPSGVDTPPSAATAPMQRARQAVRDGLADPALRQALERAAAFLARHFHRDAGR